MNSEETCYNSMPNLNHIIEIWITSTLDGLFIGRFDLAEDEFYLD